MRVQGLYQSFTIGGAAIAAVPKIGGKTDSLVAAIIVDVGTLVPPIYAVCLESPIWRRVRAHS